MRLSGKSKRYILATSVLLIIVILTIIEMAHQYAVADIPVFLSVFMHVFVMTFIIGVIESAVKLYKSIKEDK